MTPAERLSETVAAKQAEKRALRDTAVKRERKTYTKQSKFVCHVRAKRESLGLSQIAVARSIGMLRSTLSHIETVSSTASLAQVRKLENFFGCSHRELWTPVEPDSLTNQPEAPTR